MKRIKMMLLSLALFAVVGGALAFKAKFNTHFCTGTAFGLDNRGVFCSNHAMASTFFVGTAYVATTTYDGNQCNTNGLLCTTTSRVLIAN